MSIGPDKKIKAPVKKERPPTTRMMLDELEDLDLDEDVHIEEERPDSYVQQSTSPN